MGYNKNTNEMEGGSTGQFQNRYDPDREYMQRLLSYEMNGPEGVTGWDYNYYSPYQTGYAAGPHWNYQNNPDGPDPNRIGLPPGGIGTGGGTPNELPADPDGNPNGPGTGGRGSGGRIPRVVGPRQATPGGQATPGQPPQRGRNIGTTMSASNKVSSVPGGPGNNPDHPSNNPNRDPNDPFDNGDPYTGDVPGNNGDYYSNGPQGPGHATFINGPGAGIPGPMVRPADRNSNALYAGPFTDWGQGGASGNAQITGGQLYNSFKGQMDNPDLPANVKSAIITGANQAANAQYDSAEGALSRYGRTTGNRAGNAAATAALAKSRADTGADVNRQVQLDFENQRQQRLNEARTGMAGLYGTEGNKLLQMFGLRAGLSQKPLAGNTQGSTHGLQIGNNFGFSMG